LQSFYEISAIVCKGHFWRRQMTSSPRSAVVVSG